MRRIILFVAAALVTSIVSGQSYSEEAIARGVSFQYTGIPTELGASVSFVDFDNDGWDDITFATLGEDPRFYKNENGVFTLIDSPFTNTENIKQLSWVDYDNDGDQDIFVTRYLSNFSLYRNDGSWNFTDVTVVAGFASTAFETFGQSWGDYNNDGFLDVYISNYNNDGPTNIFYRNNGDGTFTDVTDAAGVANGSWYSFGSLWIDYNHDGWQDLFVINDRQAARNYMYKNNGDGTFSDVTVALGLDYYIFSMSYTGADYDNDGDMDIFVSNNPFGHLLHRQNEDNTYTEVADQVGVATYDMGWTGVWFDYDNNGWQDLYICCSPFWAATGVNKFYKNEAMGSSFVLDLSPGFNTTGGWSHSAAVGDVNNDGMFDLVVANDEPGWSELYMSTPGSNNFLKVKLQGTNSNRDGIGTWITIWTDGMQQVRYTYNGEGYLAQNSKSEIFGLGTATVVDSLKLEWLSGQVDMYYNIDVNQTLELIESSGVPPQVLYSGSTLLCTGDSLLLSSQSEFGMVEWSNGITSDSIYVTEPGLYSYVVVDGPLSLTSDEVEVIFYPPLEVTMSTQGVSCYGLADGSISVVIEGGTPPYEYGILGSDLSALPAGEYSLSVTDDNGCSLDEPVVITEPLELITVLSVIDVNEELLGTASLNIEGGTPPYVVVWSTGDEGLEVNNLAEGSYSVEITDEMGCTSVLDFTVVNTGIDLELEYAAQVYPNPAKSSVFIESEKTIVELRLYSLAGQLLLTNLEHRSPGVSTCALPAAIAQGKYILYLVYEDGTVHRHLLGVIAQ